MKCPACYFNNRKGATECSNCGATMLARDRAVRAEYQQSAEKRKHDEDLFTARHEQHRYRLPPQFQDEPDEAFCERIRKQKTPLVIAENQKALEKLMAALPFVHWDKRDYKQQLAELNAKAAHASEATVAREPGSDDELTGGNP